MDYGFLPVASVAVNLSMLQPFQALGEQRLILAAFAGLAVVLFTVWFFFRKEERGPALALLLVGLLPLVRFAVISNHSALHPFMTYRELLLTVVAVACAMRCSVARLSSQKETPRKRQRR